MIEPLPTPALPCPRCRSRLRLKGKQPRGGNRIGNQRSTCSLCNIFAQKVMRLARTRLKAKYEAEYEKIRLQVEMDLYPLVIEDWNKQHPKLEPKDIKLDMNGMVITDDD